MNLSQLANLSNGKLIGKSTDFNGFSIDSRSINLNEVYIALKGKNFDGHEFLSEAQSKGAVAVIVSKSEQLSIPQIIVNDTYDFMTTIANHNRKQFQGKVIGITGTNGKTSTKQIISNLLNNNGECHKTIGNMNNQIGVPFSLLSLENHFQFSVIEMGTSEPGEIEILTHQVKPNISAITNVSMGHLQGLSDTHSIAIEKGNILNFQTENGVAFLPQDSEFINLWRKSTNASDIFTFGFDKVSDFRVSDINIELDKNLTSFSLSFDGKKEDLCINGISFHNAMNAALSFGIAIYCERSVSQIKENLLSCELPQRRLSVFKSINDSTLIDDSYNSNPASLKNALDSLEGFK